MTPVIVKLLDITRLLKRVFAKTKCFVFEIQVKNFDAGQLTCGVQFN